MNSSVAPRSESGSEKPQQIPTASAKLPDGQLAEMVFDPVERRTRFVVGNGDAWGYEEAVSLSPAERLVPFSPGNNLVKHQVVLFASEPEEYGNEAALVSGIREFIRRYVDLNEEFEEIATYYVLFTWIYDAFDEVPYVRVRGGYGSGKTRFLLTVGSLCRLPIFASAASTVSPLFRLLDAFRGTLILDEGDFRYSDEKSEVVKILNNGNARGFPVLRTEVSRQKEFDPRAYHVFGPKLVATRGFFQDKALESRCLTEDMRGGPLRPGMPLNLDDRFRDEALRLRNQLLLYRLRHFHDVRALVVGTGDLEPRLTQVFGPLLSVIEDPSARERISASLQKFNEELKDERAESVEAELLAVVRDLVARGPEQSLTVKEITTEFLARHGDEYERRATPRWIGSILRRRLGLRPSRNTGTFSLSPEEIAKLQALYARYGIPVEEKKIAA
ncbi:MAG: hypothetical protein JO093_13620 [Acidobacteria bacterium]|nr:hypothetical protein [Acidobacteriota bacterium]MBV9068504.1 hypothetical protein [Acidobacteriota bacterium]MBV9186652.1 hypothetical protein [Acidobacteriota bacterium]